MLFVTEIILPLILLVSLNCLVPTRQREGEGSLNTNELSCVESLLAYRLSQPIQLQ